MQKDLSAYIALGGNLGEVKTTFKHAIELIEERIGPCPRVSDFITTPALVPPELEGTKQPDFLNGVLLCKTSLAPPDILSQLLKIEITLGRDREKTVHWGPRSIDLDLLAVDDIIIDSDSLTLPHPEMLKRDFVLIPLAQIAPDFSHPITKQSVHHYLGEVA